MKFNFSEGEMRSLVGAGVFLLVLGDSEIEKTQSFETAEQKLLEDYGNSYHKEFKTLAELTEFLLQDLIKTRGEK